MAKIEWCDKTINPVKGLCPVACDYCYARRMYKRFKWNPEIRFDDNAFVLLLKIKQPSIIFVGSTMELFGDWIRPEWMHSIRSFCRAFSEHTFIFLTKRPQNLVKWSPFPDNCWVGATVTNIDQLNNAIGGLHIIKAKVKFLSLEPLLEQMPDNLSSGLVGAGISWLIIGQQTPVKKATMPKIEWLMEIVEACDKAHIPVFLKNNLNDFIYGEYGGKYKRIFKYAQDGGRELRQELPPMLDI